MTSSSGGEGETARQRRAAGTPLNPRRVTSELGGVSPTIIVPGPWSEADIAFQRAAAGDAEDEQRRV